MYIENVRNFCIIAHIDHGKSTLADRILQICNKWENIKGSQILDDMDLEKERGITIKLNAIQLNYHSKLKNTDYLFHLIDTPGHVDFSYEVSRSLAACEGAILIVDATQGVQAQTISNVYLALENNLEIIPIINKVDLPAANIEAVKKEIEQILGLSTEDIPLVSAKTGHNIDQVFEKIIEKIPSPKVDSTKPLQALIFDSYYDNHLGVIISIAVKSGKISINDNVKLMNSKFSFIVRSVYIKNPNKIPKDYLEAGEVGIISGNIKDVSDISIGDTITTVINPSPESLPGYKKMQSNVFCGLFPVNRADYESLKDALAKLKLNDASLVYEPEFSEALGFGYRCGFLGLLHADIIQERLEREYHLNLIATTSNVIYKIINTKNEELIIDNPTKLPERQSIKEILEPYTIAKIITPNEYIGNIMELCIDSRGVYQKTEIIDEKRQMIIFEIPLQEIIYNFFDSLKSLTKGYASFDYEIIGYKPNRLVKLDIMLNGEVIDALSTIIHNEKAYYRGREICKKLKEIIPKKQFEIAIQAGIGKKIIARETISAYRKNVLSKCYGGDISRKKKLLEKQKEGKKRMKTFGNIEIPQNAFMTILKTNTKK